MREGLEEAETDRDETKECVRIGLVSSAQTLDIQGGTNVRVIKLH